MTKPMGDTMGTDKQITELKIALEKCRSEAVKTKPNPDKIFEIADDALRNAAGFR